MEIKEKIEKLILEGESGIGIFCKRGLGGSTYYSGEEYEKWISKCENIMELHFKNTSSFVRFLRLVKEP